MNYGETLQRLESMLVNRSTMPPSELQARLDHSRNLEGKTFADDEYFWRVVYVVFYAGIKAYRISDRRDTIRKHLGDYRKVSGYTEGQIQEVLADPEIREIWLHKDRVLASVNNTRAFKRLIDEHGSFQRYIDTFEPYASFENLIRLKEDLEVQFERFRDATAFHFLTDSGLTVLKPDRVVCRVFYRLGIIKREDQLMTAVLQGRMIAKVTGYSVRYVDTLFVAHGQDRVPDLGIEHGICSESNPECSQCQLTAHCLYFNGQLLKR
jgi:DNA-3-methyladenine glycosylase I